MVKIIKYDDLGQGICKINNKVCFVKKAIPDEEVEMKIIKDKKNYQEGIIEKIILPSSERVTPVCPFYDKCGGCDFLHTTENLEKQFKINRCLDYFQDMNNFYDTEDNYRNKVTLHFKNNKLGYYEENTNNIVDIESCYLTNKKTNEVIKILKNNLSKNDLGEVLIRSNNKEEILVAIFGNYQNINDLINNKNINNLIINDKVLKGNNFLIEEIDNNKFIVNYKSFFQVNRKGLENINTILKKFFDNKKINNVLDLYSGTSVLGILVSRFVKKVISVEMNKNATSDAKENLKLNNINNLEIITGKVEDNIDKFHNIDLVIIDPARRGLDKKTISYLKEINSSYIIYISCNIHSLKRDLELLNDTYKINEINIVDMFKRTNNVETVVILNFNK